MTNADAIRAAYMAAYDIKRRKNKAKAVRRWTDACRALLATATTAGK